MTDVAPLPYMLTYYQVYRTMADALARSTGQEYSHDIEMLLTMQHAYDIANDKMMYQFSYGGAYYTAHAESHDLALHPKEFADKILVSAVKYLKQYL